jgi:hypothetical protein
MKRSAAALSRLLEHLTLVIHRPPQVDHLAVQLHVHLVQMPAPVAKAAHPAHALAANVTGEQRAEPVQPQPDRLMADVDPALEQQVFHVPQRQWEADVHQHHQPDHLGRRVEATERGGGLGSGFGGHMRIVSGTRGAATLI